MSSSPIDTVEESLRVEREREDWEREQVGPGGPRRVVQRSVSRERWVETLVVADAKLIEYHGSDNVESYIFTIMNMVRKGWQAEGGWRDVSVVVYREHRYRTPVLGYQVRLYRCEFKCQMKQLLTQLKCGKMLILFEQHWKTRAEGPLFTVGAIIIWSLADFVGLPTYKEWNCV